MLVALKKAGCEVKARHLICEPCDQNAGVGGGFSPERGVVLCENNVLSQRLVDELLIHELIHAF